MVATAVDYSWFERRYRALCGSYCLTLVADLNAAEVVHRIGGRDPLLLPGELIVQEPDPETLERLPAEYADVPRRCREEHVVAVTETPGWALLLETRGFLGTDPDRAAALSTGTTLVAHHVSGAGGRFLWMHDGAVQLTFSPGRPEQPAGREAGAQAEVMAEVGFRGDRNGDGASPAAPSLAYTDYLTGVRLQPGTLHSLLYLAVTVTDRGNGDSRQVVPAGPGCW